MRLAGSEVPIIGSDNLVFTQLTVPRRHHHPHSPPPEDDAPFAPSPRDHAFYSTSRDGLSYLVGRIDKDVPHALELLDMSFQKEFPKNGIRILFPDALSPLSFICINELNLAARSPYLLYAITVSGVAFVIRLKEISSYISRSSLIIPEDEIVDFDLRAYSDHGSITCSAAAAGCLLVGMRDGSIVCTMLGSLLPNTPGFLHVLREDSGIGRIWGFVSRVKSIGAVQDVSMRDIRGKRLAFAIHSDGTLCVWDLSVNRKVLTHGGNAQWLPGATVRQMRVGDCNDEMNAMPLAILYKPNMEGSMESIDVVGVIFDAVDRFSFTVKPLRPSINIEEGGCIDVTFSSDKLWVVKENGLESYSLFHFKTNFEDEDCYTLQEEFVADQLFQSSEHLVYDLLWVARSILISMEDQVGPLLSSVFLNRLLQPGIYNAVVLRATMLDYNRGLTDSELHSLTVDGLKKELLLLMEYEGLNETTISKFFRWKNFSNRYFHHWCKNNYPVVLMSPSPRGGIGLIRKNSISVFRSSAEIELLLSGSGEIKDIPGCGPCTVDDSFEWDILVQVLVCVSSVSQLVGKVASTVLYEVFTRMPSISSEEILCNLMKILHTGYVSPVAPEHQSNIRLDVAWEKELVAQKNIRKFSLDIFLNLRSLLNTASSWGNVLKVIERYLKFLVPHKNAQSPGAGMSLSVNGNILLQATSQVAKTMFESAVDTLLFLCYLVNISGQIEMSPDDVSRIHVELIPLVHEIMAEWSIIHYFVSTPSESIADEDFSEQLSSLTIDSCADRGTWDDKLGKPDLFVGSLVLSGASFSILNDRSLPLPQLVTSSAQTFSSWMIWGVTAEDSSVFCSHSTELAPVLIRHGQYGAVETILNVVEAHARKKCISRSLQSDNTEWCFLHHLLGCCLLLQSKKLHGSIKEGKIADAVRHLFKASSGEGAFQALRKMLNGSIFPDHDLSSLETPPGWRLHYYQWAMQMFEQHNLSEGACQFAYAALEQVDEALSSTGVNGVRDTDNKAATTTKGRLWANIFKFMLDLNQLYDAYCAIISNPNEENKYICLKHFIAVLYERGALKMMCNGQLPLIGLTEKVERELLWKAERSDIMVKENPYKFLYAFEMHQKNWRRAATYMYQYTVRLRAEAAMKHSQQLSYFFQERLNGLSATINALHLVDPEHAWFVPLTKFQSEHYPTKKAKLAIEQTAADCISQTFDGFLDIDKLESEFVLTSCEHLLFLASRKCSFSGALDTLPELVDLLVEENLYDMAFTLLQKFWKSSELKRLLERVFSALALKCSPSMTESPSLRSNFRKPGLLLMSSNDEAALPDISYTHPAYQATNRWDNLELYLNRYKEYHGKLPLVVAESLLQSDSQIELPLWLVHMFKSGRSDKSWGMAGKESNPASLFQLYVDYGRYKEAIEVLQEYIESFAAVRPSQLRNRKRPCAAWFPYVTIERLWCQLEELSTSGHMVEHCQKLQRALRGMLMSHLQQLKADSSDVLSSFAVS
ncbi:hypothetical protein MLD38_013371 [Melastoma candidum]|uniref:Uncharacterized protein n=1 Tax=Melastoma candidum TaxID=119954 RepID=A0ACB9R8S5_9MYRT|nr:hypothetical protein MLD38_013371 [Melastoma candidum]